MVPDLFFNSQGGPQYNVTDGVNPTAAAVPEPSSLAIFNAAFFGFALFRYGKKAV